MATIRKLRGKWQAMVRRKGLAPRAKSFERKADAERWARDLEAQVDACGVLPDTRQAEQTTLADVLRRYRDEITPRKRGAEQERIRINALLRRDLCHRTLAGLTSADWSQAPIPSRTQHAQRPVPGEGPGLSHCGPRTRPQPPLS